jgi:hypothetical protein
MIEKICLWIYRKGRRAQRDMVRADVSETIGTPPGPSFEDGLHFHVHDAENGKVLQVFNTRQHQMAQFSASSSKNNGTKTYIIGHDENVIECITRALVEERIK